MEDNKKIIAMVVSPSNNAFLRKGKGFSLKEISQAGKTVQELDKLNIQIDFFRKSARQENIESLKNFKSQKAYAKKRKPFTAKEKRRTAFKPKKEKEEPIITEEKVPAPQKAKEVVKPAPIKEVSIKAKSKVIKAEISKGGKIPLTKLSGLGSTTEKKFVELGVESVEDLVAEDPNELSQLVKGCSEDRIKKWIEEAKELIQK